MMGTTTGFLIGLGAFSAGGALLVVETAAGPQDWTVLALLASVVLGIGSKLVHSVEKQVAATSENGKQIAVLIEHLEETAKQAAAQRAAEMQALRDILQRMPADVSNYCQRGAKP